MYIRSIAVSGLAGVERFQADDLGRLVRVAGPPRARTALADALTLALCPFSVADINAGAEALGWGEVEIEAEWKDRPVADAVIIPRPHAVLRMVAPPARRGQPFQVRVDLKLTMDPPQLEALRQAAIREPRLAPALVGGTPLEMSVGWLFTRDGVVGTPSLLGARLGDVVVRPGELPDWFTPLLRGLQGRVLRRRPGDMNLDALAEADRSADPKRRAAVRAMSADLARAPFRLGHLSLIQLEDETIEVAFDDELVPLRALGPEASEAVGLVSAVHLHPCEVLALESPLALASNRGSWLRWLTRQVEAEGSPLEQLWLFGAEGPDALRPKRRDR